VFRLISATPSPYARKVRIALAEKGIPFELLTEVPWDSTTETPRHNPLEKLPVLLLPDGSSVYESHFILEWLELKHPTPPMLPPDIDGRLAAQRVEVVCDGVCDALVLLFMERNRAPEHRSTEWMARQQRKVEGGLRSVGRHARVDRGGPLRPGRHRGGHRLPLPRCAVSRASVARQAPEPRRDERPAGASALVPELGSGGAAHQR